ncbi:uncharacterized protein LOC121380414 [Gigantopelta aegis]|uniref:uncharacterized protein LOC121380414 n=1 Tax=Gigantopelta aegis TaxID=1735272 RepID=UPI001B88E3B3|nr:uncharacterized protein LOC121380414 [Gigantopelta aegis]
MGNSRSKPPTEKEKLKQCRVQHVDHLLECSSGLADDTNSSSMGQSHGCSVEATGDKYPSPRPRGCLSKVVSMDEVDSQAISVHPQDYDFPFENLVFEGGGSKGLAYCGALQFLEEIGQMSKIRRLAGASAGAMTATLVAVGYTSGEIEAFLSEDIDDIFMDHRCGYCSLLPNLITRYGWNPGRRIFEWFGYKLEAKTGNPDITFEELRLKTGKELCIVVTNLNQMNTEYCHPKTTPDIPVRLALRMSISIPGVFMAIQYTMHGQTDTFVDGGLLCNYPIHSFDGWYLSMAPEDGFLHKLQPLRDLPKLFDKRQRFGSVNKNTLGFLLYADKERDILKYELEKRIGVLSPERPNIPTKLYEQSLKQRKFEERAEHEHRRVTKAVDAFFKVLLKHNLDRNDVIDRSELENAFKDETEFSREQAELLFGKDVTVDKAFAILDQDGNGKIIHNELVRFVEETGICLQSRFLGYQRKEVNSLFTFLNSLQNSLLTNVKKIFVETSDLQRTVGINTGHVGTIDLMLEDADREFVVERGYNSTRAFLQYYVVENCLQKRQTEPRESEVAPNTDISQETDLADSEATEKSPLVES